MKKTLAAVGVAVAMVSCGAGVASADSDANGTADNSPGILGGNVIQVPVHVPVNLCGDTVSVIGLLNPASGAACTAS